MPNLSWWVVYQFFLCEGKGVHWSQGLDEPCPHHYRDHPNRCTHHSHRLCPTPCALHFHHLSSSEALALCTCAVVLVLYLEDMTTKINPINYTDKKTKQFTCLNSPRNILKRTKNIFFFSLRNLNKHLEGTPKKQEATTFR